RDSLWILAGAVAFLFLVVCANVANLTLSRSLARTRDFAVRSALGATRLDLLREALVEHALIAIAGCAAGIGFGMLLIRAATAVLPEAMTSRTFNAIELDGRSLAIAAGLAVMASILFGLPAALVSSRTSIAQLLGAGS